MVRTCATPDFEITWHRHEEYELIVWLSGSGSYLAGDRIGEYQQGDVYLIGKNLPHWFGKATSDSHGSAVKINFSRIFLVEIF
jgi:quercetin dioxygenase-like cupin family protein